MSMIVTNCLRLPKAALQQSIFVALNVKLNDKLKEKLVAICNANFGRRLMPLNATDLIDRKTYFVCQPTVVLKQTNTGETGINCSPSAPMAQI